MFMNTTLSFVPAIPSRTADHTGSRFSVWFAEHVIKHNRSGTVAMFIVGTNGKHIYVKGAPTKGTTISDFFESASLEERVMEWADANPTAVAAFRAPVTTPAPTPAAHCEELEDDMLDADLELESRCEFDEEEVVTIRINATQLANILRNR